MITRSTSSLLAIALCAASGPAQTRATRPAAPAATDIRAVDFENFDYASAYCAREYGKLGRTVRVRDGEHKSGDAYFTVESDDLKYGDVTGDGRDDAVVTAACGSVGANYNNVEIYVYTIRGGRAALLAEISDRELERDYRRFYPKTETYWGHPLDGVKVADGKISIDVLADGPHAAPQYVATLTYAVRGGALRAAGAKPERRAMEYPADGGR